jgi:predicted DNA-binding protein with PD1-like motif
MGAREFARGRRIVARLPHGGDLLEEIAAVAEAHGMQAAELRAIGALQTARLAFYDQTTHEYGEFPVDAPVELVGLLGNVSRRDGATAVHAHATLARHDGACVGGHVAPGCVIFACELILQELVGEPLERGHDETTGLPLWRGL